MNCSAFQLSAKMVAIGTAVGTIPLITIDKAIAASGQFSAGNPGTK